MFFQELRLSLASGLCDRSVERGASEREFRASEKDEDNDRLKIVFYFTRGYLGKLKSYRDKSKIVLKGKVLRF